MEYPLWHSEFSAGQLKETTMHRSPKAPRRRVLPRQRQCRQPPEYLPRPTSSPRRRLATANQVPLCRSPPQTTSGTPPEMDFDVSAHASVSAMVAAFATQAVPAKASMPLIIVARRMVIETKNKAMTEWLKIRLDSLEKTIQRAA